MSYFEQLEALGDVVPSEAAAIAKRINAAKEPCGCFYTHKLDSGLEEISLEVEDFKRISGTRRRNLSVAGTEVTFAYPS